MRNYARIIHLFILLNAGSAYAFQDCRLGDLDTSKTKENVAHRQIVCRGIKGFVRDDDMPAEVDVTIYNPATQVSHQAHNVGNTLYNPSNKGYALPTFKELQGNLAQNKRLTQVLGKMGVTVGKNEQVHVTTLGLSKDTKLYDSPAATKEVSSGED